MYRPRDVPSHEKAGGGGGGGGGGGNKGEGNDRYVDMMDLCIQKHNKDEAHGIHKFNPAWHPVSDMPQRYLASGFGSNLSRQRCLCDQACPTQQHHVTQGPTTV